MRGRRLFQEIKAHGYTGSFSNLERLLAKWRNPKRKSMKTALTVPDSPCHVALNCKNAAVRALCCSLFENLSATKLSIMLQ